MKEMNVDDNTLAFMCMQIGVGMDIHTKRVALVRR